MHPPCSCVHPCMHAMDRGGSRSSASLAVVRPPIEKVACTHYACMHMPSPRADAEDFAVLHLVEWTAVASLDSISVKKRHAEMPAGAVAARAAGSCYMEACTNAARAAGVPDLPDDAPISSASPPSVLPSLLPSLGCSERCSGEQSLGVHMAAAATRCGCGSAVAFATASAAATDGQSPRLADAERLTDAERLADAERAGLSGGRASACRRKPSACESTLPRIEHPGRQHIRHGSSHGSGREARGLAATGAQPMDAPKQKLRRRAPPPRTPSDAAATSVVAGGDSLCA